jgi:Arc/MetJ-type ribon-helix-helix transcriptional regulator
VIITLKPEQERLIDEEIKSGHFTSAEEVLDHALAALRDKRQSRLDAVRRIREFGQKHRLSLGGIRIKDLIHEGHRL